MAYIESSSVSAASYHGQKASTAEESIMKNVNLYRGCASPNITLASLEGLDGLDIALSACYQPERLFTKPNRSSSSGILGTGMMMPLAAILVKSRTKRENYQSEYYSSGEGGNFPLYRKGKNGDAVEFLSVEHAFWKYRMYDNRWEVVREDGSVWTYGGTPDSREINVAWGNWTGPCSDFGGEEFSVGWYLSKVVSCCGNVISFDYDNRKLPLGGCYYTSELHLKTAVSVFGQTVKLNYLPKMDEEYVLPHRADRGAYQFLCERHYLDSLEVFSAEGKVLHSQKLIYDLIPTAAGESKRLLTSVCQVTKDGEVLLPLKIGWETKGDYAGHISKITYPREGALEFGYSKLEAAGYESSTFVDCTEDWNKTLASGSDFTAALFTRDDRVRLKIMSWDMTWLVYEDDFLQNQSVQNASLFLGNGIVVVRYLSARDQNYTIRIIKRVPVRRYDWEGFDVCLQSAACPSIACGSDYVAVQYPDKNGLMVYQFNYLDNLWHEYELPVAAMGRQIIGAGEGCIFGAYGYDNSQSVRLVTFYSDEDHNWRVGGTMDVPAAVDWDYEASLPVWSVNGSIASACFISDGGDNINATMIAVSWDADFQISGQEILKVSQPKTIGNPISYSVTTETMIGFGNTAFRYTPSGFIRNTLFQVSEDCEYAYAYSGDLMVGVEKQLNGNQRFAVSRFDAALGIWTDEGVPFTDMYSNLNGLCYPFAASDYAVLGRSVFMRQTDERWMDIGYLPEEADITTVRLDPGGSYLLYSVPQVNLVRYVPLSPLGLGDSVDIEGGQTGGFKYYEAGLSGFFLSSVPGQVSGVSFYTLFGQKYEKEVPKVTCIKHITLDSGLDRQTVYVDYDMNCARLENGSFAAGSASVCPVCEDGSFGQTVYSYYNGGAPARVRYPQSDQYCNVAEFYTHFEGQIQSTASYDGDHKKISESHSFMKAFDSHGFCIQQTKINKSDFVPRFSLDRRDVGEMWDEIKSSVEYRYEQKYYRRRRILQSSYDKNGKEIMISQNFTYAFEDDQEMEAANLLNNITISETVHETDQQVLSASRYEYGKNSDGYYYQTAEYSRGREEGEWLEIEAVTAVDHRCRKLCGRDSRGLPTAVLYDKDGVYPVAVTAYAQPEEVLYCGFEPYEVTDRLTMDGEPVDPCITKEECFSGTGCLRLDRGKKLGFWVKTRDDGMHLRFYARVKDMAAIICVSLDFGGGDIVEKTIVLQNSWMAFSEDFCAKSKVDSVAVTISADDDIWLDVLYATPVMADGEAYVYAGNLKLQTAAHRNNGVGTRTYFDRYDTPCICVEDCGRLVSFTNTVYSTDGRPNEMYTIKPSSEGDWYDVRQGYSYSPLFRPQGSGWEFVDSRHFALLLLTGPARPSISFGDVRLDCAGDVWTLKNGQETQTAPAPKGTIYLLLKMGDRCRFYGDGTIVFTFTCQTSDPMLKLMGAGDVNCFGYVPDPHVSVSCADYSGRVWQDQILTEKGVRIVHTLYNQLGVQLARTTQVEIPDGFWGYRPEFVTDYNRETGETKGEINSFFPESEHYPCTSYKTTLSSSPQVKELAQPGKLFAFGSGFTVKHERCSVAGLPEIVKEGCCQGDLTTDADGMVTFNVSDGKGKAVSGRVSADGRMREITAYDLDAWGNETTIYYPNYFSGDENSEEFISVLTYDSLGHVASRKDPDADLVLSVFDRFGNLRFIRQEESGLSYLYHLYDKFGRKTEMGYVDAVWDSAALYKMADEENLRPEAGVPVKQLFYDEDSGSGKQANQKGKLTKLVTSTGGKTVEERWEYDSWGRQIRYILLMEDRKEECVTTYDGAGNVTSRSTGNPHDGVLEYRYGVNGELTSVKYGGKEIYGCGYSSQGSLAYETFGEQTRCDYSYNTANYLTEMKGNYFSQQLTYFGVSHGTDEIKRGGQLSQVETQWDEPSRNSSSLSVSYDAFGRVASASFHKEDPPIYCYDANGNQLRQGLVYQTGSDRFSSIDGEAVSYEGYGAVKAVGNRYELQYEPVTQMAMNITSEKNHIKYRIGNGICGFEQEHGLTFSVLSEDGRLFFERSKDGVAAILVYGANGVFAQILDGKVYYLIKDYRSTVCGIAGSSSLLASYSYDLFGNITDKWEDPSLPLGLIPLRFAGARLEKNGLYRFKMRLYDPYAGRFLSPDPEAQYANPYLYGGCDWINYFDPDGAFNIGGFLASLFVGLALTVVGVAITVATAGMGGAAGVTLGIIGAGIIGAGISSTIYSVTSAINDDFSWSSWGIQMGMGAVFGMASAGIGAAMPAGMSAASSIAYDFVSGMVVGAADGVVTNGMLNISNGKEFFDNVLTNATVGAAFGGVMGAITGMSTAARNAKSMVKNGGPNVDQLGFTNAKGHTKVGIRHGNAGDVVHGTHLAMFNPPKANIVNANPQRFMENAPKWINVKHTVYLNADQAMNAAMGSAGKYNIVFNNCTGYAIRISSGSGIYQPLWARTPITLDWWMSLTRSFQN